MKKLKSKVSKKAMRKFATGATRDNDAQKLNYIGSLSPLVLRCFTQFMRDHNIKGGELKRNEGNWKKGMPLKSYIESKIRHFVDTWIVHEEYEEGDIIEMLCADLFNTQGYLHELLVKQLKKKGKKEYTFQISETELAKIANGKMKPKDIKKILLRGKL